MSDATLGSSAPVYKDEILEIEPHGLEHITRDERHGKPWHLFTLWLAANLCLATWIVGQLSVQVFGESVQGAIIALVIGNILGAACLSTLSSFGPKFGVPQMVQSRAPFGFLGNYGPGALNYLAGIGWFAVNTVYGVFALQTLTHMPYWLALLIIVVGQVILAVYGYNMIHAFERIMSILLGIVFVILAYFTFANPHANFAAPFNPKAHSRIWRRGWRLHHHRRPGILLHARLDGIRVRLLTLSPARYQALGNVLEYVPGRFCSLHRAGNHGGGDHDDPLSSQRRVPHRRHRQSDAWTAGWPGTPGHHLRDCHRQRTEYL